MAQKNGPVKKIRYGCICAAIWANQSENRKVWFNVTVTRSYMDGDQWKDSSAFRLDDLPIVTKVVDKAFDWIWEQSAPAETNGEVE